MYRQEILAYEAGLRAAHLPMVFHGGLAGVFCSLPLTTQTNLAYLFFTEWYVDCFIGVVIQKA